MSDLAQRFTSTQVRRYFGRAVRSVVKFKWKVCLWAKEIKRCKVDKEHDEMTAVQQNLCYTVVYLEADDIVSVSRVKKSGREILLCYSTRTTNTLIISYPLFTRVFVLLQHLLSSL